jgi:hypothetical protein
MEEQDVIVFTQELEPPPQLDVLNEPSVTPSFYDESILAWFKSVMPRLTNKRGGFKTERAVMAELDIVGESAPDLALAEEYVIQKLQNMLIFFSGHDQNRREFEIFSRYYMKVRIGPSKIAGYGLFTNARNGVDKDQPITVYGGLRLPPWAPVVDKSNYIVNVYDPDDPNLILFRIDGAHSFLLNEAGRWANRATSEDDANAELRYNKSSKELELIATRYIPPLEEIFWDYGPGYTLSVESKLSSFYI